jgi:3-oxoacyl-[acyl-carrier protein] reductase
LVNTPVRASLEGRVAMITGAGRNIGRSIALELAAEGTDIVILVRSSYEEANGVAKEVRSRGRHALVAVADVRDEQAIGHVVEETREALEPVTILVNNAAVRRETWISGDIFGN